MTNKEIDELFDIITESKYLLKKYKYLEEEFCI